MTGHAKRKGKSQGNVDAAHQRAMMDVLMQFRVIVRSIRRHYKIVEERSGVSGAQLWAMAQIAATPGMKVSDLARALAVHQSTASNLLEKLETARLVERHRIKDDRRVVRLVLTSKGKEIVARAPRPLRGVLQQALLDLPTSRLTTLRRSLTELIRRTKLHEDREQAPMLADVMSSTRRRVSKTNGGRTRHETKARSSAPHM